jgi:hypothetical protein
MILLDLPLLAESWRQMTRPMFRWEVFVRPSYGSGRRKFIANAARKISKVGGSLRDA